jgi:regulator of sirC expression with transglutaminase-like and TPR domain
VIDPFSGQSLSREELESRLQPYRRRQRQLAGVEVPLAVFLQAAAPRDILARLLANLKEIHRSAQDWRRLLGVQDRLVILLPERAEERRDRGLVRAELGLDDAAAEDLAAYLASRVGAPDARAVGERLEQLRRRGGARLH